MSYLLYPSPLGDLEIVAESSVIVAIRFAAIGAGAGLSNDDARPSPLDTAAIWLERYFAGMNEPFPAPLASGGTVFQRSVWEALRAIPYGETASYGEIARAIGSPGAARAVGMACNRNPIAIAIPCHRVVGSSGDLTGYAGGLDAKRFLLELESASTQLHLL